MQVVALGVGAHLVRVAALVPAEEEEVVDDLIDGIIDFFRFMFLVGKHIEHHEDPFFVNFSFSHSFIA